MAVQKNRKSPSKRGMRRAHNALTAPALGFDPESSEQHRRHHLTPNGYYRGRQVIVSPAVENEDDD